MKKRHLLTMLAAAVSLSFAPLAFAKAPVKACFVYIGSHNDNGYSESHERGRLYMQKQLGDKVESSYVENVAEGPDSTRVINQLARSGCNIIFATSFGYMNSVIKVAKRFPNVKFEHATGLKTAKNVATYRARFYEGRYVEGVIAAKMSKNGEAGYIGTFPIPEVIMGMNAFMLGAQSINPDFKIHIIWTNSWFDPGKEADAAKALFNQGIGVLAQHSDSSAAMQVAEKRGELAFGQASDQIKFGPDAQLTSIVYEWGPYYTKRVEALINGTWKSHAYWKGFKANMLFMAPFTNMPADVKTLAENTVKKITDGFNPFTGPVYKQDGSLWLKKGQVAKDTVLLGMNFFVKGITDKMPH